MAISHSVDGYQPVRGGAHPGAQVKLVYFVAIACSAALALGQVLFKLSANAMQASGSYADVRGMLYLALAFALYGGASVAWVWALQRGGLGHLYPFMALAYVLVPVASWLFFEERFDGQYLIGVRLIVVGVILSARGG